MIGTMDHHQSQNRAFIALAGGVAICLHHAGPNLYGSSGGQPIAVAIALAMQRDLAKAGVLRGVVVVRLAVDPRSDTISLLSARPATPSELEWVAIQSAAELAVLRGTSGRVGTGDGDGDGQIVVGSDPGISPSDEPIEEPFDDVPHVPTASYSYRARLRSLVRAAKGSLFWRAVSQEVPGPVTIEGVRPVVDAGGAVLFSYPSGALMAEAGRAVLALEALLDKRDEEIHQVAEACTDAEARIADVARACNRAGDIDTCLKLLTAWCVLRASRGLDVSSLDLDAESTASSSEAATVAIDPVRIRIHAGRDALLGLELAQLTGDVDLGIMSGLLERIGAARRGLDWVELVTATRHAQYVRYRDAIREILAAGVLDAELTTKLVALQFEGEPQPPRTAVEPDTGRAREVERVHQIAARYASWTRMGDALPPGSGWYDVIWPDEDEPVRVWLFVEASIPGIPAWGHDPSDDPEAMELDHEHPLEIAWRLAPAPGADKTDVLGWYERTEPVTE